MNVIMDTDTDGNIRLACRKDNPNHGKLAALALRAVDGLCSYGYSECFGRYDYAAVRAYAERLLKTGELKYELVEHCAAEGIKYSTAAPHYIFAYSAHCKGFDGGDAWHAGISSAMYAKVYWLLSDNGLPPDGEFYAEPRRMPLTPGAVSAVPRRDGGAELSFDIRVGEFAGMLSGERYMELLQAVHRYGMQPQLHCMFLLFDTEGIKKLSRYMLSGLLRETEPKGEVINDGHAIVCDNPIKELAESRGIAATCGNLDRVELHSNDGSVTVLHGARLKEGPIQVTCSGSAEVSNEAQFCVPAAEPANVVPVTHGIDGEDRRRAYEGALEKREEMWTSCRRALESAGVDPTPLEVGLYKVAPGTSLDLFVAGSVTALASQCEGKVQEFTAYRGDRRTLVAPAHDAAYLFVSGPHVATARVRKDGTDTVSAAAPMPCDEVTVTDGKTLMLRYRGTVLAGPLPDGGAQMADRSGFERIGPGVFKVYGSRSMYALSVPESCNVKPQEPGA